MSKRHPAHLLLSSIAQPSDVDPTAPVARRLRLHSMLSTDAAPALERLLGRPTQHEAGSLVARAGDEADLVAVVQHGVACRTSLLSDGRRQIHSLLLPGDTADAEAALLSVRQDNIEALSDCSIWLVPKNRFASLLHNEPQLAEAFTREAAICAQVARQWLVNVGRRDAIERLAHFICELYLRLDAIGAVEDGAMVLPLTQEDIADAQGISPVHANRVLQELRARRLISSDRQRLRVLDWDSLASLGLFDAGYLNIGKVAA